MRKCNSICRLIIPYVFTLAICLPGCNNSQDPFKDKIITGAEGARIDAELTPFLEGIMESHKLPGLAIGLVKNNEIVYARAFGFDNVADSIPTGIHSLYHMASISKPFVATAIMQLVEKGKIDLDEPIVSYLPYFKVKGESYDEITVMQMLSHISGMPDVQDYEWYAPQYDAGAIERYVRSLTGEEMIAEPGTRFAYSNMAFECLGDVISKVSGMSFADYVKINILDPIGMQESTFLKPEHLPENWASPHMRKIVLEQASDYPYNRRHGPSSTLHSNVVEMSYWALANMNLGIYDEQRILAAESYNDLWMPWFQLGETSHIGLSWFLDEFRGYKTVGHGGGDLGFNTYLTMIPKEKMSVVVVCNLYPAPVRALANSALDVMLGHEPDKVKTPASIAVFGEMEAHGVESAIELWKTLEAEQSEDYSFEPQQFFVLVDAMRTNRVEDAVKLTRLCVGIFPAEIIRYVNDEAANHLENNPDNEAARKMIELIEESIADN